MLFKRSFYAVTASRVETKIAAGGDSPEKSNETKFTTVNDDGFCRARSIILKACAGVSMFAVFAKESRALLIRPPDWSGGMKLCPGS